MYIVSAYIRLKFLDVRVSLEVDRIERTTVLQVIRQIAVESK